MVSRMEKKSKFLRKLVNMNLIPVKNNDNIKEATKMKSENENEESAVQDIPVETAFQAVCRFMRDNVNNTSVLEQVVYVPMTPFFTAAMSGYSGFQPAQGAAGIYIVPRRKIETPQFPHQYICVPGQVY